jgi:hypothetical protein
MVFEKICKVNITKNFWWAEINESLEIKIIRYYENTETENVERVKLNNLCFLIFHFSQ